MYVSNRGRAKPLKIKHAHKLNVDPDCFQDIQRSLASNITLRLPHSDYHIQLCAGVDLAYWRKNNVEMGVCSIVVVDLETMEIVEKTASTGEVTVPYIPGFLAFRELSLILKAAKKLMGKPDLFLFDGNGFLHPRHMGIATHASFFLNTPAIGVAKNYFKIKGIEFIPPGNVPGDFSDIMIDEKVFGRVLRTRKDVKPVFVSSGNFIDLQSSTELVMNMVGNESRIPVPLRVADIDSRKWRRQME